MITTGGRDQAGAVGTWLQKVALYTLRRGHGRQRRSLRSGKPGTENGHNNEGEVTVTEKGLAYDMDQRRNL